MKEQRIVIIGSGGNMGEIFVNRLLASGYPSEQIIGSTRTKPTQNRMKANYGIEVFRDNIKAVSQGNIVILAIKPDVVPVVLPTLRDHIRKDAMIISIAAGKTLETITELSGCPNVVRAMPTILGIIGASLTYWTNSRDLPSMQKADAVKILKTLGKTINTVNEQDITKATISIASGISTVLYILEAYEDACVRLGHPRNEAKIITEETFLATILFAKKNTGSHLAALRNRVTSAGGTSAEILSVLDKAGTRGIIGDALMAGYNRALKLG